MQGNENFLPKYLVVYNDIYKKITNNIFVEDEVLPSESELQKYYGVSRITIRRAMEELQQIGLIKKYPGIGTIVVSNKKVVDLKRLASFSAENLNESSELINFQIIDAPINVQVNLKLKKDEKVYHIERIRKINNNRIGLHSAYVPTKIIQLSINDFKLESNSLYKIFNQNNIYLNNGSETIEAIEADSNVQELLNVPKHYPILYKERTSFSDNIPIEFVKMYYRGDMYKYHIELDNE